MLFKETQVFRGLSPHSLMRGIKRSFFYLMSAYLMSDSIIPRIKHLQHRQVFFILVNLLSELHECVNPDNIRRLILLQYLCVLDAVLYLCMSRQYT